MQKGRGGQKYIFASGFLTVDQLMEILEGVTGRRRPMRLPPGLMMGIARVTSPMISRFFPAAPQRFTPAAVQLLTMARSADCSKAREELGYRPTPLRDAVQAAYDHFVQRGLVNHPRLAPRAAGAA
jgi:nucleoside-diphosphate-sugar epimerase